MEAVVFAKTGFPGAEELGDAGNDDGQNNHSWKLDRTIPIAFLWTALVALVLGVWWLVTLSATIGQHTAELADIRATLQVVSQAVSKVDALSTQTAQTAASVSLLAAANQRITSLETNVAELHADTNNTRQTLGIITERLARIETKLDSIQPSGESKRR
jgi:uncharacterized coiled-coil protein SlyX